MATEEQINTLLQNRLIGRVVVGDGKGPLLGRVVGLDTAPGRRFMVFHLVDATADDASGIRTAMSPAVPEKTTQHSVRGIVLPNIDLDTPISRVHWTNDVYDTFEWVDTGNYLEHAFGRFLFQEAFWPPTSADMFVSVLWPHGSPALESLEYYNTPEKTYGAITAEKVTTSQVLASSVSGHTTTYTTSNGETTAHKLKFRENLLTFDGVPHDAATVNIGGFSYSQGTDWPTSTNNKWGFTGGGNKLTVPRRIRQGWLLQEVLNSVSDPKTLWKTNFAATDWAE